MRVFRDDLMVQEQIQNEWEHMIGVIMLNQTYRKQVKKVLPDFLQRFPTPESVVKSRIIDIENIIAPLGMKKVRAKRIYRMSLDYLTWDKNNATMLYGIGKYGSDSYEIFFKNNFNVQPTDKELKKYISKFVI